MPVRMAIWKNNENIPPVLSGCYRWELFVYKETISRSLHDISCAIIAIRRILHGKNSGLYSRVGSTALVALLYLVLWKQNPQGKAAILCVEFTESPVLFTECSNVAGSIAVIFLRGEGQSGFTEQDISLVTIGKLDHKSGHIEYFDLNMPLILGHLAAL